MAPLSIPAQSYTWVDQTQIDTRFRLLAGFDAEQVGAALIPAALELNQPLERFFAFHMPTIPESTYEITQPFLQIEPATVVVGALKKADLQDALVIRLVETIGKETEVVAQLAGNPPHTFSMMPNQIMTWMVSRIDWRLIWRAVNLLEEEIIDSI